MDCEFVLPLHPEDLERAADDDRFVVEQLQDIEAIGESDAAELLDAVFERIGGDAEEILDHSNFDVLYSFVKTFPNCSSGLKRRIIITLCNRLGVVQAGIVHFRRDAGDSEEQSARSRTRNALKMYSFLLGWIADVEEKNFASAKAQESAQAAATGKGRGKGRSKKPASDADFNWEECRFQIVHSLTLTFENDGEVAGLWGASAPEAEFLSLHLRAAFAILEKAVGAHLREVRQRVCRLVAAPVLRYKESNCATEAATTLVNSIRRSEAMGLHGAELVCCFPEGSPARKSFLELVLVEIGRLDHKDLARDNEGAKSFCTFLTELGDRAPADALTQMRHVYPLISGESYHMRNAVVAVAARCLDYLATLPESEMREKTRASFIEMLRARARDVSAYTRGRVLQAWTYLVENTCAEKRVLLPTEFRTVAAVAARRLEDKSAIVRKSAVQLLGTLLEHNPFRPSLRLAPIEADVARLQAAVDAELEALRAAAGASAAARAGVAGRAAGAGAGAGAGAEAAEKEDGMDAEGGDAAAEAEAEAEAEAGVEVEATVADEELTSERLTKLRAELEREATARDLVKELGEAMPGICQLLGSRTAGDVTEAVDFLVKAHALQLDAAEEGIRRMLLLVWSKEGDISTRVLDAFKRIYLQPILPDAPHLSADQREARFAQAVAHGLVRLAVQANLGELTSLEELVACLTRAGDLPASVIAALWDFFSHRIPNVKKENARGALMVLCFAGNARPEIIHANVQTLISVGFGPRCRDDELVARYTCVALQKLAKREFPDLKRALEAKLKPGHAIFRKLARIIEGEGLNDASWFPAAEQAINAVYALCLRPEELCAELLRRLARRVFGDGSSSSSSSASGSDAASGRGSSGSSSSSGGGAEGGDAMAADAEAPAPAPAEAAAAAPGEATPGQLARLFFVVGHVALKHVVYMEEVAALIKRRRAQIELLTQQEAADKATALKAAKEKDAAAAKEKEKRKGKKKAGEEEEDAEEGGAEGGAKPRKSGRKSAAGNDLDEELGISAAAADAEEEALREMTERQLLGDSLLGAFGPLVARVCEQPRRYSDPALKASAVLALCKLMCVSSEFCEAHLQLLFSVLKAAPEAGVRSNIVISLGDIAFRFPNQVDPWTEHVYARLRDEDTTVRKNTLMVLSHLVLNDMVKVKGNIGEMALCLVDGEPRIKDLAHLFFQELSKKSNNPIYNILPDVISRLSVDPAVSASSFQAVMKVLLPFVTLERQIESLHEKLCHRFPGTQEPHVWRNIAFCISQLPCNDKSAKKLGDLFPLYAPALGDKDVYDCFVGTIAKAKRSTKAETKQAAEELEAKMNAAHQQGVEDRETVEKATNATKGRRGRKAPARAGSDAEEDKENAGRKTSNANEASDDDGAGAAPKARGKVSKTPAKGRGPKAAAKGKGRGGGRKKAAAPSSGEEEASGDAMELDEAPAPRRRAAAARGKAKAKPASDEEEEEQEEAPVLKPRNRTAAAAAGPAAAGKARGRAGAARRAKVADSEDEASDCD
eukprot:tig00021070_g17937.t1